MLLNLFLNKYYLTLTIQLSIYAAFVLIIS